MDPELARFLLALGAVGDLHRAAELAGVDPARAEAWVEGLERPGWLSRRSEVARRLFMVADEALERVRALLRGDLCDHPAPPLRELVMVAERFFAAALKLDKNVGADAGTTFEFDLDGWTQDPDSLGHPDAARGAADRDA